MQEIKMIVWKLFRKGVRALYNLSNLKIWHWDLHANNLFLQLPENELLDQIIARPDLNFTSETEYVFKIIDFGEGRDLALANPNTQEWGNVGVRAPEAKSLKACELGDVWSFGMLTLYLLTPSERGWIDWSDCN